MGDDDKGLVQLVAEAEEKAVQFVSGLGVEVSRGFVREDGAGGVDEGAGDGDALLFPAGEFGRFVGCPFFESEEFEQGGGFAGGFAAAVAFDPGGDADVFESGEFRQEVMELENEADVAVAESGELAGRVAGDIFAVVEDFAAVGGVERAEDVEKGAFAGTAGAGDGDHFTVGDDEVDAAQDAEGAVAFDDIFDFYHGCSFCGVKVVKFEIFSV